MFVRPTTCLRHEQAILPQRRGLDLPLTKRFFVFEIAISRLRRRTASARNSDNLQRVRQSPADKVNSISTLDAIARRWSLVVYPHMPACHRSSRQAPRFEESAIKQPSINAQRFSGRRHIGTLLRHFSRRHIILGRHWRNAQNEENGGDNRDVNVADGIGNSR